VCVIVGISLISMSVKETDTLPILSSDTDDVLIRTLKS